VGQHQESITTAHLLRLAKCRGADETDKAHLHFGVARLEQRRQQHEVIVLTPHHVTLFIVIKHSLHPTLLAIHRPEARTFFSILSSVTMLTLWRYVWKLGAGSPMSFSTTLMNTCSDCKSLLLRPIEKAPNSKAISHDPKGGPTLRWASWCASSAV